jgi:serralysin
MTIKHGTAGADTLVGTSGADQLFGEGGSDVLKGLAGGDTLDGGSGRDTIDYSGSARGVRVQLDDGAGFNSDAEGDVYVGVENVVGSSSGDDLTGDAAGNRLSGGEGNDVLDGGAGNNTLLGGAGDDLFRGAPGAEVIGGGLGTRDFVTYAASALGVNVDLSNGLAGGGDAAGDVLTGVEFLAGTSLSDTLAGSAAANELFGNSGADRLAGLAGADSLFGNAGADTLEGGAGADIFFFDDTDDSPAGFLSRDVINDFSTTQGDRIALFAIDANDADAGDDAFEFLGRDGFIDTAGQVEYTFVGGNTVVRVNTGGDLAPEMEIQLQGNIDLVAGNFFL